MAFRRLRNWTKILSSRGKSGDSIELKKNVKNTLKKYEKNGLFLLKNWPFFDIIKSWKKKRF